ncbi:AAA family ATPase [Ralstonia pseudosolanacearum]
MATTKKSGGKLWPDFKVMLGAAPSINSPLPPFSALVIPSSYKWNDFGFRTSVEIHARLEGQQFEFPAFFGYITSTKDELSDARKLEEMMEADSELTIAAQGSQRFFTMLSSMEDYRRIVTRLGTEAAGRLLIALNDVVALAELVPKSNIPKLAADTPVFQKSFIRTAESFFAFKNAGAILRGVEEERFGRMSEEIEVKFLLSGRKNAHELKFRFDHSADLPKRIAVVIGKNGVGKSQALGQMVRAALVGDDESLRDAGTSSRVLMNRLLAFAPTNESASVFPGERRKNAKVWYKRFSLNRGGRTRRGEGVADTVLQVARSGDRIGKSTRWRIFLSAIQAISDWHEIVLLMKDKSISPVPLSALRSQDGEASLLELFASIDSSKDPVRLVGGGTYPLSSGEISFLRFAAQACLYIENGSLLLLDEPETHLHPNFISSFVAVLDNVLAQTGSAAVIATHSVYFVREVFSEQVTVLRTKDGIVSIEPLRLQTFGADVGAISYFVFEEEAPSKLATEVKARLLARYQTWEDLYQNYGDELSPKLLGTLRLALESDKR